MKSHCISTVLLPVLVLDTKAYLRSDLLLHLDFHWLNNIVSLVQIRRISNQ